MKYGRVQEEIPGAASMNFGLNVLLCCVIVLEYFIYSAVLVNTLKIGLESSKMSTRLPAGM